MNEKILMISRSMVSSIWIGVVAAKLMQTLLWMSLQIENGIIVFSESGRSEFSLDISYVLWQPCVWPCPQSKLH